MFSRVVLVNDTRSNNARSMPKKTKLDETMQRKFFHHENYILLNKRTSCCSMRINVSPRIMSNSTEFFGLISIYVVSELLVFIFLQIFA